MFRITSNYVEANEEDRNGEKNYPAAAGSGRANQCDRGTKRDSRHVEIRAHCGRLAVAIGHRLSDQDHFDDEAFPDYALPKTKTRWKKRAQTKRKQ